MAVPASSSSPLIDTYAAGLINGEGYIGIQGTGGSFQVRLKIGMTDKGLPALHRMQRAYGGTVTLDRLAVEQSRESHVWRLTGRAACAVIEAVRPWLVIKSEPARIALQFQAMVDSSPRLPNGRATWTETMRLKAGEFRTRIQEANRTGPDPTPPTLPPLSPLAVHRSGAWWMPEDDLFGPVEYEGKFPTCGLMVAGRMYATPMDSGTPTSAPPMAGSGSSSSLPTPRASRGASGTETMYALGGERSDEGRPQGEVLLKTPTSQLAVNGGSQHPDKRKLGGHGPTLADEVEHLLPSSGTHRAVSARPEEWESDTDAPSTPPTRLLLPTPGATDGTHGGPNQRGSSGDLMLPSAVVQLLPTPAVNDMGEGKTPEAWDTWTLTDSSTPQTLLLLPTPSSMNAASDPGSVESWMERRDRQAARRINGNGIGMPLGIAVQLLPTPTVNDFGDRTEKHAEKHGNQNGHGKSLDIEARKCAAGEPTDQPSSAGKPSSDE